MTLSLQIKIIEKYFFFIECRHLFILRDNGNVLLFEHLILWFWDWSDLYRVQDWRWYIEAVHSPCHEALPSVVQTSSKGIQNIIFGNGLAAGVVLNLFVLRANRLRAPHRNFLPRFNAMDLFVFEHERVLHPLIDIVELTGSMDQKQVGWLWGDSGPSSRHLRLRER